MDRAKLIEYRNNPNKFFADAWGDAILWDKLIEVNNSVVNNRRTIVPSGHGVGKSWDMGRLALWFLFCFYPAKVITTAPTWGQVENILWAEIKKAYNSCAFPLGGRLLSTELKIEDDWFAIGFSTTGKSGEREYGATKFQGYHSPNLLIILDEGPGVEHSIWVATETLISGENNRIVAIGNPTSPTGDFYEACKSPLWNKINISCFDHPNVKENEIIVPGAVTTQWIDERRQEWGEDSPLWKAKVLGDFPDEGDDTLIPLSWIEACVGLDLPADGDKTLGADIARFGGDMTVIAQFYGAVLQPLEAVNKKDTNWTIGRIANLNTENGFTAIGIDDTGVGGGVTDGLQDRGLDVDPMNFGSNAIENDKFENLKAEIYWNLREAIKNKEISLPKDDKELVNQLASIKYGFTRKGHIKIESKEDMKKRGLKSPDKADAVAIAYSAGRIQAMPEVTIVSSGADDEDD